MIKTFIMSKFMKRKRIIYEHHYLEIYLHIGTEGTLFNIDTRFPNFLEFYSNYCYRIGIFDMQYEWE